MLALVAGILGWGLSELLQKAELYVNGLSSDILKKINSEEFLDGVVKRINAKQVG